MFSPKQKVWDGTDLNQQQMSRFLAAFEVDPAGAGPKGLLLEVSQRSLTQAHYHFDRERKLHQISLFEGTMLQHRVLIGTDGTLSLGSLKDSKPVNSDEKEAALRKFEIIVSAVELFRREKAKRLSLPERP